MGTKIIIATVLSFIILGCDPAKEFCDDIGKFARVPDLVTLEPLQSTYSKGDVVTLKINVENMSPYFGEPPVNLFEATGFEECNVDRRKCSIV